MVGFEKALGAVKVIKDRIQYRSQSLLSSARGDFSIPCEKADTKIKEMKKVGIFGYACRVAGAIQQNILQELSQLAPEI